MCAYTSSLVCSRTPYPMFLSVAHQLAQARQQILINNDDFKKKEAMFLAQLSDSRKETAAFTAALADAKNKLDDAAKLHEQQVDIHRQVCAYIGRIYIDKKIKQVRLCVCVCDSEPPFFCSETHAALNHTTPINTHNYF